MFRNLAFTLISAGKSSRQHIPKFNNEILRKGVESFQRNVNLSQCLHVNEIILLDTAVPEFVLKFIFL